jgi:hypothetical protein
MITPRHLVAAEHLSDRTLGNVRWHASVLVSTSSGAAAFLTEMAFCFEKPTDESNCGENSLEGRHLKVELRLRLI